jgi:hypothetical protein
MQKAITLFSINILILLLSCNQEVNVDLPSYNGKIVVDGWIEQDGYAKVLLTKSAPYFGKLDSIALRELVLTRAKVSVSDGETTEVLTLHPNPDYFPPLLYSGYQLKGEIGKTYQLTIEYAEQKITAETSIPIPPKVEKIWFETDPKEPEKGMIWASISDDPAQTNFYRIFTQTIGLEQKYFPIAFPNYSDQSFNGQGRNIPLYPGTSNTMSSHPKENYSLEDTVLIKICTMDRMAFKYWEDFQQEMINSKNPFATSNTTLNSNIQGDALGIWCGYGAHYSRITATKQSEN